MKWFSRFRCKDNNRSGAHLSDDRTRIAVFLLVNFPDEVRALLPPGVQLPDLLPTERSEYYRTGTFPEPVRRWAQDYGTGLLAYLHRLFPVPLTLSHDRAMSAAADADFLGYADRATATWPRLPDGLPYRALHDYYPTSMGQVVSEVSASRYLVWDFKYGRADTDPRAHARVLAQIVRELQQVIVDAFGDGVGTLTFFCIPASNTDSQWLRYREFSRLLCARTGMQDSFAHVHIRGEREPVHMGGSRDGNWNLDVGWFRGRAVLIFDDVLTTGGSTRLAVAALRQAGAMPVAAVYIGHTVKKSDYDTSGYK